MAVVIYEEGKSDSIPVSYLRDGEIAVIVEIPGRPQYIGKLLQRYYDHLVLLGEPGNLGWSRGAVTCDETFRVRRISAGAILRVAEPPRVEP